MGKLQSVAQGPSDTGEASHMAHQTFLSNHTSGITLSPSTQRLKCWLNCSSCEIKAELSPREAVLIQAEQSHFNWIWCKFLPNLWNTASVHEFFLFEVWGKLGLYQSPVLSDRLPLRYSTRGKRDVSQGVYLSEDLMSYRTSDLAQRSAKTR